MDWTLAPAVPAAGDATLLSLILRDRAGQPVNGASLQVAAHMSHPGMSPVIAIAAERGAGVYDVTLQFTMAGDWTLLVTGTLPGGRRVNHRIDLANVRPAR
jgi:hypothetical protein